MAAEAPEKCRERIVRRCEVVDVVLRVDRAVALAVVPEARRRRVVGDSLPDFDRSDGRTRRWKALYVVWAELNGAVMLCV